MQVSGSYYQSTFEQQYLQSSDTKHCFGINVSSRLFDKLCNDVRLTDFELILLYLFMFNVSGIIEVTEIEFFNYSRTDRVKRNKKKIKK